MKFINAVAKIVENAHRLNLTTTTPAIVHALAKSDEWNLVRQGVVKGSMADIDSKYGIDKRFGDANSNDRVTYSFNHKQPSYRLNLTTTTPSIVHALAKSDEWNLVRQGRSKTGFSPTDKDFGHIVASGSDDRVTYSFNHKEVNSVGTG